MAFTSSLLLAADVTSNLAPNFPVGWDLVILITPAIVLRP